MRFLPFSTVAAWWVLACPMVAGETSTRSLAGGGDGVLARGAPISPQRNLKPASSRSDPINCCEFTGELLRLDQSCSDAITTLETEIACEGSFGIVSSSTSALPFKAYSRAVNNFDAYLLDYELGVFPNLSGLNCTTELLTFGGYCLLGEVIVVDSVDPPVFTYSQPAIPFPVADLIFTVPAP